jgi:hypothetical protein
MHGFRLLNGHATGILHTAIAIFHLCGGGGALSVFKPGASCANAAMENNAVKLVISRIFFICSLYCQNTA